MHVKKVNDPKTHFWLERAALSLSGTPPAAAGAVALDAAND